MGSRARAARRNGGALLDLDHFKKFNDTQGHPAGDRLLHDAARAWQTQLRPGDLLARYSGEEFGVVFSDSTTVKDAQTVLRRLQTVTPHDQTFSGGLAARVGEFEPAEILADVDAALYCAKRAGRNRVYAHDADPALVPASA